jgi:hypothetical protein
MSNPVEKLRLREVYHHLLTPPSAAKELARVMRASILVFQWSTTDSSRWEGDNGFQSLYPFWGISKSFE